ncbi:MAG: T9SS type A sorting domain-containing protein [Chlorobi bacterium]|nr:T9SS type A sorting domain-containing protein [Chlorobiota bacterium]
MLGKKFISTVFLSVLFAFGSSSLSADLKSEYNQADYLIITHPDYLSSVENFADWRASKGLNVQTVSIDDIYTEFPADDDNVQSIIEFISFALTNWNDPAPKYVLLVGSINNIPARVDSSSILDEKFVSMDHYYSVNIYENDIIPDIAVGRFPARSVDDLGNMISKTMRFEENFYDINYQYDMLLTTEDDYGLFETQVQSLIDNILPEYLEIKRIDFRDDSQYHGDKNDFFAAIDDGTVWLGNYFHGTPDVWSRSDTISIEDFENHQFTNKPFIMFAESCSQRFDDPEEKSIVELLISEPDGGSVASVAFSGYTWANASADLLQEFHKKVFEYTIPTLGEVFLEVKQENDSKFNRRFALLGDPALKIPNLRKATVSNTPVALEEAKIYPNPFADDALLTFNMTKPGDVSVDIYDLTGKKMISVAEDYFQSGRIEIPLKITNLNTGCYICLLRINGEVSSVVLNKMSD